MRGSLSARYAGSQRGGRALPARCIAGEPRRSDHRVSIHALDVFVIILGRCIKVIQVGVDVCEGRSEKRGKAKLAGLSARAACPCGWWQVRSSAQLLDAHLLWHNKNPPCHAHRQPSRGRAGQGAGPAAHQRWCRRHRRRPQSRGSPARSPAPAPGASPPADGGAARAAPGWEAEARRVERRTLQCAGAEQGSHAGGAGASGAPAAAGPACVHWLLGRASHAAPSHGHQ